MREGAEQVNVGMIRIPVGHNGATSQHIKTSVRYKTPGYQLLLVVGTAYEFPNQ
ncbi:hypothetical protein DYBT9275_02257 [Dyadobacter sp. CECT 9275]|uniref:Uncharacterized protein n=1 Tax=Dyadobacter helix TaxID=2822344 RepID=A0A916JBA7_9BACT|nr:hypothetical protein [Dyadobacter sp. CECT 9275]CAG4999582.1 hypothetical protein DYBT9275_02257 [Dyadobacter sp. CECT 9275]